MGLPEGFPVESPVVTWSEWEAVQERLKLNKLHARRNAEKTYMLVGMLFCGHDGWRIQVDGRQNRPSHTYKCPRSQRQSVGVVACDTKYLNGTSTDEAVWETLSRFLSDPHTFEASMWGYARKFGGDEERWAIAGSLHDFDWEICPTPEDHPAYGAQILRDHG